MKNFQNLLDGEGMKFTEDVIKSCRMCAVFLDEPACSVFNLALDEIERLQARVQELEIYNKNFHLACINALDLHRESDVPKLKDIPKIIEELRTRVQELEMFQDLVNRWSDQYYRDTNKLKQRIAELEEALAKIANYESMRFRLSPYEYGVLEQIVGIAEHALR